MLSIIFVLSALAVIVLWGLTGWASRRQSRVGKQVTFLVGTFVAAPMFAVALFILMSEHVFDGVDKPVGPGVIAIAGFSAVVTLATWLLGYWTASATGWWLRRS